MSDRYLLDSNAFIEAKNRYYGFDVCPGFWTSLIAQHLRSRLFSIDRVEGELQRQHDEIAEWMTQRVPDTFFKKTDDQRVIDAFQVMVNWVFGQAQFTDAAKAEFASEADGWVIAFAAANGLVVVTHEQYEPAAKKRVPMPNVCIEFNVRYVNTFDMLRALGESLFAGPSEAAQNEAYA